MMIIIIILGKIMIKVHICLDPCKRTQTDVLKITFNKNPKKISPGRQHLECHLYYLSLLFSLKITCHTTLFYFILSNSYSIILSRPK